MLMLSWKQNLEAGLMWNMTWSVHHHVLCLEYLHFLTGPQPADDIFGGSKMIVSWCCTPQLNMFLNNSKGAIARLSPSLRLCFPTTNRHNFRIDCSERFVIKSCLYFCSVHVQHISQWRSCPVNGPRTLCLLIIWATCLKKFIIPGLLIPGHHTKMLRAVMVAYLLYRCKHLCSLC